MVTRNNYISKLKRHNEKALEFVVQEYGGESRCVQEPFGYAGGN